MTRLPLAPIIAVSFLLWAAHFSSAWGQQPDEFDQLKRAVQLRAPGIEELKKSGAFKEAPGGLLLAAGPEISPAQRRLLEEENTARTRLFELIAARSQKTPEDVAAAFHALAARGTPVPPPPVPNPAPAATAQASSPSPAAPPRAQSADQPLLNPRTKELKFKVLSRPLAAVYSEPSPNALKVQENTPAFSAYYVYQKQDGWYEVGTNGTGKKLGWMKAEDVVEWKQNLVVKYSHPEGRKPVLMFHEKEPLKALVDASGPERSSRAMKLYTDIDHDRIPADFPVVTMEPARAVNSESQFYLLPIINYIPIEIGPRSGMLLQLAASSRKRGTSSLQDPAERAQLRRATDMSGQAARGAQVDLVFVMDLTRSMGPFADATLAMIKRMVSELGSDPGLVETMRFGFWGYRDFPEKCPAGMEYNTRNYTPELLTLNEFAQRLNQVKETKADSVDYEEDVFAGVADALTKTQWRPGAMRQIVLVGDAPGRAPGQTGVGYPDGPKGTKSNLDVEGVRALANESHAYITALYLKASKWLEYAEEGTRQFGILARNPNSHNGAENVRVLDADDKSVYASTADSLAHGITDILRSVRSGQHPDLGDSDASSAPPARDVKTPDAGRAAGKELARNMFRGAFVEWLGAKDAATVPRDVTAWASDKDLLDPSIQSLEEQVYLTKNELNNLKLMADSVVNAAIRGKISGEDFFKSLQAVVTAAATNPEQIRKAETLGKSGLVPEFLRDLPYQSTLMKMTNEDWSRKSTDGQDQFITSVNAKLQYYQMLHDDAERWVKLNPEDDSDNAVASVPIEQLP